MKMFVNTKADAGNNLNPLLFGIFCNLQHCLFVRDTNFYIMGIPTCPWILCSAGKTGSVQIYMFFPKKKKKKGDWEGHHL